MNWVVITCTHERGACYDRAAAACPNGYAIADGADHEGAYVQRTQTGAYVVPTYKGEMLVHCR